MGVLDVEKQTKSILSEVSPWRKRRRKLENYIGEIFKRWK